MVKLKGVVGQKCIGSSWAFAFGVLSSGLKPMCIKVHRDKFIIVKSEYQT